MWLNFVRLSKRNKHQKIIKEEKGNLLCHDNMLKPVWDRNGNTSINNVKLVNVIIVKSVNIVKINHDPDNETDTII